MSLLTIAAVLDVIRESRLYKGVENMADMPKVKLGIKNYRLDKFDMGEHGELNLTLVLINRNNMTPQIEAETLLAVMKALGETGVDISNKE